MQTRADMLSAPYAFIRSHRLFHYNFYYSYWNKSHWVLYQYLIHSGLLLATSATEYLGPQKHDKARLILFIIMLILLQCP